MRASSESGGNNVLQCSQVGRSSSIVFLSSREQVSTNTASHERCLSARTMHAYRPLHLPVVVKDSALYGKPTTWRVVSQVAYAQRRCIASPWAYYPPLRGPTPGPD